MLRCYRTFESHVVPPRWCAVCDSPRSFAPVPPPAAAPLRTGLRPLALKISFAVAATAERVPQNRGAGPQGQTAGSAGRLIRWSGDVTPKRTTHNAQPISARNGTRNTQNKQNTRTRNKKQYGH